VRIAYLIAWRGGRSSGPFRKMAGQAAAWRSHGHDVRMFVSTDEAHAADWRELPGDNLVLVGPASAMNAVRARTALSRAALAWGPDVVYLRHSVWSPGLGRLLRQVPGVLEVNGDEVLVLRTQSRPRALFAAATRGRVLRRARGAVYVTRELSQSPSFAPYGLPALVLGNGVDLSTLTPLPAATGASPRLVVLSHPGTPWHGVDKLVGLARREPTWDFDVIGPVPADFGAQIPPNMHLHGWCAPEVYLPIVARADVGIGALAMHRIGISEASALKVREYLGLGLPVLSGCADPDVPPGAQWFLELPNSQDNVEQGHARIVEFVQRWKGCRVDRSEVTHLDSAAKEVARLAFLETVVSR
jgi:hypothetical protein